MASRNKSYTPPKGRPTTSRDDQRQGASRIPPMFEWIMVGIVIAALLAAAWFFSSRSDSSPHSGVGPAVSTSAVIADQTG